MFVKILSCRRCKMQAISTTITIKILPQRIIRSHPPVAWANISQLLAGVYIQSIEMLPKFRLWQRFGASTSTVFRMVSQLSRRQCSQKCFWHDLAGPIPSVSIITMANIFPSRINDRQVSSICNDLTRVPCRSILFLVLFWSLALSHLTEPRRPPL